MKRIEHAEAQRIELDILIAFSEYCKKNGLRYCLANGTMLGAVRHQGFIPWDNDVDVFMPRPDYEKLLEMVKHKPVADHIRLLDYREERTFPFAKAVDTRTVCKEHFLVTEENMGLYLDIFPLDGMPETEAEQKRILRKIRLFYKLYVFANYRFNTGSTTLKRCIKNLLYPVSRLVPSRWVCEQLNAVCKAYPYDESVMAANVVWGEEERSLVPRAWYDTPIVGHFENHEVIIPADYDKILTQLYGDYMQLPPENERRVHVFDAYWK